MPHDHPSEWKTQSGPGDRVIVHAYPVFDGQHRPHDLYGESCWCRCKIEAPCPMCDPQSIYENCGICSGTGWISARVDSPKIVIYHEETRGLVSMLEQLIG